MTQLNTLKNVDCLDGLAKLKPGSIDLAFADPPFNIGYEYDVYKDQRSSKDYLDWCRKWIGATVKTLKPDGTFWLAIGDEYAAEMKVMMQQEHKLSCRSWVIWYYTFGVNCKMKFSRSHAHLFHMVKDPKQFTFNSDAIRVPSARQLVYGDKRANSKGRLPDDTWVLRPQDLPEGFQFDHDTWYFPRVAGTFKERAGWHGCQMPEQLLGRIIRACSLPGETVLDPFAGSGTTLAVAKKLERSYIGFELSAEYTRSVENRLRNAKVGEPLDGAPEPLVSAPATAAGRRLDGVHKLPVAKRKTSGTATTRNNPIKVSAKEAKSPTSSTKKTSKGAATKDASANSSSKKNGGHRAISKVDVCDDESPARKKKRAAKKTAPKVAAKDTAKATTKKPSRRKTVKNKATRRKATIQASKTRGAKRAKSQSAAMLDRQKRFDFAVDDA